MDYNMQQESVQNNDGLRIKSLDGLRGLAIFLVLGFHTYARWPDLIPWVTTNKEFLVFKLGFLGVDLFFLISGFVIYMTLEKCHSFSEFIFKRWLRLFPAMLIATILVYSTSFFLTERPNGDIKFFDIFSGLLFIQDWILNKIQNFVEIKTIEGVFWSLFVEVKFYFVFGALYFYNKNTALRNLVIIFLLSFGYDLFEKTYPLFSLKIIDKIFTLFDLRYFGWFCVGALLYKSYSTNNNIMRYTSAFLMVPTILIIYGINVELIIACAVVYLLFYLTLYNKFFSNIFSTKLLVFVGFISYPLYLIHENAMVALTIKTRNNFSFIPDFMTPWPGIIVIILFAYIVAKYLEPVTKSILKKYITS
jgi:peptidoglycan/LPS O-acetylase OafA/YrhL